MVRRRNALIADRLRRLDKFPQGRGLAANIDNRKGYAEFHLYLRSVALWLRRALLAPSVGDHIFLS